ncbi:periplasmic binding protein-like I [Catenaria anguillulae PL171]|uniref:Periplasmic binding protein-like I n=1 Tax=Catenaria anguillulae PL171 TaxID=765915 RepID=A0A1Y2HAY0_9FUNG|nr:periplasmic binding protein-like I [Catenaria anguillulae PL171]
MLQELIPGYRLNLSYTATSYNRSQALAASLPAFLSRDLQALVGDWLSRVNVPTAVALGRTYTLWQCSGSATSSELAIKADFPYFFRTLPDDPQIGYAMAAFIQSMGWKSVALLSATDSYGQSLVTNFGIAAPQFGIETAIKQTFDAPVGDVTAQLLAIKASGLRIIMLMGQSIDALGVVPQAIKLGLTGPDYVWIGAEAMIDLFYIAAHSPDIIKAGDGWMVVYPAERETSWTRRLVSAWQREYPNLGVPAYGLSYVDCVVAVGRGLARLADRFGYDRVMSRNYSTTLTTFLDSFEGFTGVVEFDSVGNRRGEYFVFNLFNKTTTAVAQIDTKYNVTQLLPFTFASGTSDVPSDRPRPEPPFARWSSPLGIATGCIVALVIMFTLACCLYLTLHRKSQSVRHLSYLFLMLTSVGCISVMASTLLRVGFPDDYNCNAVTWLDISGVNLVLACSAAKAYRVYVVFDNAQLGRYKRITSRDLMIGVSVIMLTQYAFVTASTVFASQVPTVVTSTTTPYYTCKASGDNNVETLLTGLNLGFVAVLASVVLYLAYKTRYVSKAFGESEWLFHAMQSLTMSILCLVPFYTLDFGEQHVLANAIKLTLLLYAASSTFYALVGRVAVMVFLQRRSAAAYDTEAPTQDMANHQSVVSGAATKSLVAEHGGHMSGTFPVKRGDKLFATWRKHRIHVCFRQGTLIILGM